VQEVPESFFPLFAGQLTQADWSAFGIWNEEHTLQSPTVDTWFKGQAPQLPRVELGVKPGGQTSQVNISAVECSPGPHGVQVFPITIDPGKQSTHWLPAVLTVCFAEHGVQTPTVEICLAGHASQTSPVSLGVRPAEQALQLIPSAEISPAKHLLQVFPETEFPTGQNAQTPLVETWFIGQGLQPPRSSVGLSPAGQNSQVNITAVEYLPTSHGEQVFPITMDPIKQSSHAFPRVLA
jgi:hypothetical protein